MLRLYHHGSSVCAAKVRMVLAEKELEWSGVYLDILKGEQFDPEYMKLNSKAVVPTLVHDGRVVVESTVIAEYLDEVFPDHPLKPEGAGDRADMRIWTKAVDEQLHPACGEVTFAACHRYVLARLGPEKLQAFLDSTPPMSVTPSWHVRKKQIVEEGFAAPRVADAFRLYDYWLGRMEEALADRAWLAGERFSLADIGLLPYVNRLDMLCMSKMWTAKRPRVAHWFERVKARPGFRPALLDMCPPDLTKDLAEFGARSWPEVQAILAGAKTGEAGRGASPL